MRRLLVSILNSIEALGNARDYLSAKGAVEKFVVDAGGLMEPSVNLYFSQLGWSTLVKSVVCYLICVWTSDHTFTNIVWFTLRRDEMKTAKRN